MKILQSQIKIPHRSTQITVQPQRLLLLNCVQICELLLLLLLKHKKKGKAQVRSPQLEADTRVLLHVS